MGRMFIMKTLTGEEVEEMHSLLKQYHPYIVERHGKAGPQYNRSRLSLKYNRTRIKIVQPATEDNQINTVHLN